MTPQPEAADAGTRVEVFDPESHTFRPATVVAAEERDGHGFVVELDGGGEVWVPDHHVNDLPDDDMARAACVADEKE